MPFQDTNVNRTGAWFLPVELFLYVLGTLFKVLPHAGGAVCEAARHNLARLWPPADEPGPTPAPGSQELGYLLNL